jgi:hypothetical protein
MGRSALDPHDRQGDGVSLLGSVASGLTIDF